MSVEPIIPEDEYDYIVCGGGTSGCVLAARLAEELPEARILVVEAGPHNRGLEQVSMVGGLFKAMNGELDWNFESLPQKGLNDRVIKLNRGKFLGGCSGFNGTLCIRGSKRNFDDWELEGWSGDEVWEYMRKSETFHGKEWFQASIKDHGTTGPLHTEPHDVAPISDLVLESMQSLGFAKIDDLFTTGEAGHGCGHVPRTVHKGLRSTSADFLTKDNHKKNVDVVVNHLVDKVIVEKVDGLLQASSIVLVNSEGARTEVKARKEIIVSGGAYCSPAILLRSGIGPKQELNDLGIECLVNLPGVGQNLQDHLVTFVAYETEQEGLTNDHLVYHGNAAIDSYMIYQEKKTGVFSTFPFGVFAYARVDEGLKDVQLWNEARKKPERDPMGLSSAQPHVEFFNTEFYSGVPHYQNYPSDGKHGFEIGTIMFSPRSSGSVKLKSSNPLEKPVIDCKYLEDPLDLLVQSEAVRLSNEIITQGVGTKGIVKGYWPREMDHNGRSKREDWIDVVRQNSASAFHAAGTCKMGKSDDALAVLDEKLRVRGVEKLRVVDVSVMPTLHGGHTQLPAFAIGQKAADLIKLAC